MERSVDEALEIFKKIFGSPPNVYNDPPRNGSCGVLDGRYDPQAREVLQSIQEAGLQVRTGLKNHRCGRVVRVPVHGEALVSERPDFRFDWEKYLKTPDIGLFRTIPFAGVKIRRYLKNARHPQMGIPDDLLPEEWALLLFARGSRTPEGERDRLCVRIGQRLQALNGSWFYRATTPEYLTLAFLKRMIQAHWHRKALLDFSGPAGNRYQDWMNTCRPLMEKARKTEGRPSALAPFAQIWNPVPPTGRELPIYPGYKRCSCCGKKIGRNDPVLFLRGFTEGLNYHEMTTCSEACFERAIRHVQASGLLKTIQDEQDLEEKRRRGRPGGCAPDPEPISFDR
jgi:hypothetical protein